MTAPATVGRTTLLVAPVVIAARGVALLVPVLIARMFGAGLVTDAFFYAAVIPTFTMVILANAFATATSPNVARIQATEPEKLPRFIGGAVTLAVLAAVGFGVVIVLALPSVLPYITSFSADEQRLCVRFVTELLPFLGFVASSQILKAACDVRGRFFVGALAPMLRGLVTMGALVALHRPIGDDALPAAMTLGQGTEAVWYVVLGWTGLIPIPNLRIDRLLKRVLGDMLRIMGGEVMVALNIVVDKAFAATLGAGAVSHLEYADRTRFIPQTLFESTILAVAFATWSNLVAQGEPGAYVRQLDQSMRWVAACTAPPLAGLYIGRHVLVSLLYQRGEFSAADASASAEAFGWYFPGLWTMILGSLAMRAHVVEGRLRLVMGLGLVSVLLNAMFDVVLRGPMGLNGLALSSALVWIVVPAGYLIALWPTLRNAVVPARWAPVGAVAAGSLVTALAVQFGHGPPKSLADPVLWVAAVVCFGLLGVGLRTTRPELT